MYAIVDAGTLNRRVEVLQLTETTENCFSWSAVRKTPARLTYTEGRSVFSEFGMGARRVELLLRPQRLDLHCALRYKGQHLLLTAITDYDRTHIAVTAAAVTVDTVTLRATPSIPAARFPGVLTEKYARHAQEWPQSVNELSLLLVTPKAIHLQPGCLVEARGAAWEITVPHELDEFKNQYEIVRRRDL